MKSTFGTSTPIESVSALCAFASFVGIAQLSLSLSCILHVTIELDS